VAALAVDGDVQIAHCGAKVASMESDPARMMRHAAYALRNADTSRSRANRTIAAAEAYVPWPRIVWSPLTCRRSRHAEHVQSCCAHVRTGHDFARRIVLRRSTVACEAEAVFSLGSDSMLATFAPQ